MEVFVNNLPDFIKKDNFKNGIRPFLTALNILKFDVKKTKKANFGSIIFIHEADGQKFLKYHGVIPVKNKSGHQILNANGKPRMKARLRIFNSDIYCDRGRNVPDKITIKTISYSHEAEEKQKEWEERQAKNDPSYNRGQTTVIFEVNRLECGYLDYQYGQCHFFSQYECRRWAGGDSEVVKFGKSNVIIKMADGMRIDIPFNSIYEIDVSKEGCTLVFILTETPRFFKSIATDFQGQPFTREDQRTRLTSLGEGHAAIAGISLVYRVTALSDGNEFSRQIKILKNRPFLSEVINENCKVPSLTHTMHLSLKDALAKFEERILEENKAGMPFDILFQIQVLVWNAYLLPSTALKVLDEIKKRINTPRQISAAAIKKMMNDIPWARPNMPSTELVSANRYFTSQHL